jgi:amino acid adenylation domain-containing protein/non-ribosomal peptide synthase protein (TIGR01720 family)
MAAHEAYWLNRFAGEVPVLELVTDKLRPAVKTYSGAMVKRSLSAAATRGIKEAGSNQGATLFMNLLAAVNVLLFKYTGQQDIIIGSPIAGREHADLEDQIGFYVNTLALRAQFSKDDSYLALLEKIKQVTLDAYKHQSYPFDELIDRLELQRDLGRHPLFDVVMVLQNATEKDAQWRSNLDGIHISDFGKDHNISKFDLTFGFEEIDGCLQLDLEFNTDLFHPATAARMADHLVQLIENIVAQPAVALNELNCLTQAEEDLVLYDFNNTRTDFPANKTVSQLFEETAATYPSHTALIVEDDSFTYAELNQLANQLAHYLRARQTIERDDRIGILLNRSEWMVVAMLAIMKAGGAYVPIDPGYPQERIDYMLADSACKLVIDEKEIAAFVQSREQYAKENPACINRPNDLIYVMYTSGSTGRPKGVMVEHTNVVRLVRNTNYVTISPDDCVLSLSNYVFDGFTFDAYAALLNGASMATRKKESFLDASTLGHFIQQNKVTVFFLTVALFNSYAESEIDFSGVRLVIFGGDAASVHHVRLFRERYPEVGLMNGYGPTENTTFSTCYKVGELAATDRSIPIGYPISNTQVYITDRWSPGQLAPIGVPGEICLGGAGITRGYLNRPGLNEEKFVNNPFSVGETMYRTGDLGRWREDGSIEFITRFDNQLKIRGYRIEPGEIEVAISQYQGITEAVVLPVSINEGERELAAYIVAHGEIDKPALRSYLLAKLPAYMVPAFIMQLAELPLNVNGKIDRKRLPQPSGNEVATGAEYLAPSTATEQKLAIIWSNLLGIDQERISVTDNFFELGGHSLKATRLSTQVYRAFEVTIELKAFFLQPVLEQQAQIIDAARGNALPSIEKIAVAESYPLSASQRRLWVLSQFADANAAYNIPAAYVFEGELDMDALSHSFTTLLARHESLRTVFRQNSNEEVRQYILPANESWCRIAYTDLRNTPNNQLPLDELITQDFARAFNLHSGPLLRATVYQLQNNKWVLSYVMHHIISDGWSMGVLIRELLQHYKNFKGLGNEAPAELRIQYKDYTAWQQQQLSGAALQAHKAYWLEHFSGTLPVVDFPADKPRPAVKTYNGGVVHKQIEAQASNNLRTLAMQQGCTLFMSLMSTINLLIYKYTGQEDIIIGSPVAGREHPDLEDQVGFYANTLALRTQFSGNDNFLQLLERVKQVTIGATAHQLYPFDQLVGDLQLVRDRSRHPLFDIQVIVQNGEDQLKNVVNGVGNLWVGEYPGAPVHASVFDLVFHFTDLQEGFKLSIAYNSDVYSEQLVRQLSEHVEALLQAIAANAAAPLNALNFLNAAEQHKLVKELNNTAIDYPANATLVSLFAGQVGRTPQSTALVSEGNTRTYQQLHEQSDRLAWYLRRHHQLQTGEAVAVMMDRNDGWIIALLGVLKSGGVYVPVDAGFPRSRKEFILRDSRCRVLLTESQYMFELDYYNGEIFAMDIQFDTLEAAPADSSFEVEPDSTAYIIYTSGSTGEPKGVMVQHRAIANTICSQQQLFEAVANEQHLQFASASFDASISEIFVSLATGSTLCIITEEQKKDPDALLAYLQTHNIALATLPPSYVRLLDKKALGLKRLVTAGEPAIAEDVREFLQYGTYINAYGPTETSICATTWKRSQGQVFNGTRVPIGKPIANTNIYVLDPQGGLCAKGVVGEVCVSGNGLAAGYLNRAGLTAEKFTADPFNPALRLYKTGDLGRWTADDELEFIGRKDEQVKLRGYRIELGEIENILQKHEQVLQAVALVREQELIAYIVSKAEKPDLATLREHAAKWLPAYMLPQHYLLLDELPLNRSGKVDKNRLPNPDSGVALDASPYQQARTEAEAALISIYEEVLKKKNVGIKDDFFVLGGDSIKSIQVVSRLKQRGFALSIQDVLMYPVVEELAKQVTSIGRSIDQSPVTGFIPLSPIQQMFFERHGVNNHHYNQSVLLYNSQFVSQAALVACLDKLVAHHDALRMRFYKDGEAWLQENQGIEKGFGFEEITVEDHLAFEEHCNRAQAGIDLANGPLFKAVLFHCSDGDRLLLICHHLVMDGVSWRILLEDLSTLYAQHLAGTPLQLPLKTDSFLYWQEQQLAYAQSALLQKEEAYWQHVEAAVIKPLAQDAQGSNRVKDGEAISFTLSEELTNRLQTKCYRAYRTEINDVLLAALVRSLQSVFRAGSIMVNMEGHGREQIAEALDITRTVGWFTTSYPVVFDKPANAGLRSQLIAVKETLHRVPNKGIGYGILRYLAGKPYTAQPQVSFNYLGDFGSGINNQQGEELFAYSYDYRGQEINGELERGVLLDVSGMITAGALRLSVSYSREQYRAATIQKLVQAYQQELEALIEFLSNEEVQQLTPVDLSYKGLTVEDLAVLNAKNDVEDAYELSPLQGGLYYHWLMEPASGAYYIQTSCRVQGNVDVALLQSSYEKLVARHATLRTCFVQVPGKSPLQVVKKNVTAAFAYQDVSGEAQFDLPAFKAADCAKGFDLSSGSQMRFTVLFLGNDTYEFIWSHHHIIMDGWCGSILISEFFQVYYSALQGKEAVLDKVPPYAGYINWLNHLDKDNSIQYWKEYLAGFEEVSSLKAGAKSGKPFLIKNISLPEHLRQAMAAFCAETGVTENTFIQVIWSILLARYNNTGDVVFGAVVSGRPTELDGVEKMVGLFSNTIPVRIQPAGQSFINLLKQVQQDAIAASRHHYVQLAEVQSLSKPGRNLFDNVIIFENYPVQEMVAEGVGHAGLLNFVSSDVLYAQINYDFTLTVVPGSTYQFRFDCNGNYFSEEQLDRMGNHLLRIMQEVLANPTCQTEAINYLSEDEQQQLLVDFNATNTLAFDHNTLTALFEQQVQRSPEAQALYYAGNSMTYVQLDAAANRLAHYLLAEYKLEKEDKVGIMLERSDYLIIAILAVLKSGAAYVPIDAQYPEARKEFILADTQAKVLLTQTEHLFNLEYFTGAVFAMDVQLAIIPGESHRPNVAIDPGSLAYVIYTSGSTGQPKGVMIGHRAIANTVQSQQLLFDVQAGFHHLQFASASFDASVSEIFVALCSGGALYIISDEEKKDPARLCEFIAQHAIDIATIPPAYLQLLEVAELKGLKRLVTAGEAATRSKAAEFAAYGNYYNAYGPTETSICGSIFKNAQGNSIEYNIVPIGKPIHNAQLYILDEQMQLMPVLLPGEIYIGGAGLARGYLNKEALTQASFVDNPSRPGERLYKTGDLGRWLPDGNVEFLGRKDSQVKISGYRIELDEIASAALQFHAVKEAVAAVKEDKEGNKEIALYFVPVEDAPSDLREEIRRTIASHLPAYMLPRHLVQMASLPLTASGKINRKALPDPSTLDQEAGESFVAPTDETAKTLALIWADVLDTGNRRVGLTDNFFDLGGHSLKAIKLISQVHKTFEVKIELKELFNHVTLEQQALLVATNRKTAFRSIANAPLLDDYPLSASQRRLWVLSSFEEGRAAYNAPGVRVFRGQLNREALRHAFALLIERHEILRTVFAMNEEGEVRQVVLATEQATNAIQYYDLRADEQQQHKLQLLVHDTLTQPFDLARGPLLRAALLQVAHEHWVFAYAMHHIISDAWSMEILVKELLLLYNAGLQSEPANLSPLKIQFKDYAYWQQQQLKGEALQESRQYWLRQFEGEVPVLELATDKPRPAIKTYNGAFVQRSLPEALSRELISLSQEQGSSLFMGLLAAVNVLLHRYTGHEDIVIGTTIAGREHADLADQIGFYVNTLPLRTAVKAGENFTSVLEKVKQVVLDAYAHQLYPFDELVGELRLQRDLSRHPLFDVLVELQEISEAGGSQPDLQGISVEEYSQPAEVISKFDLRFAFSRAGQDTLLMLEYNTDLYHHDTIERMAAHLVQLLQAIVASPITAVGQLDYLQEQEKQQLLVSFNQSNVPQPYVSVVALFDEQVRTAPDAVAVAFNGLQLTYAQLNKKAEKLAHHLRNKYAAGANDLIGIMLDRSDKMVIALLAVLKSGAAYVPIDPAYPRQRKEYMVNDTRIKVLLTQTDYIFDIDYYNGDVFAIDVEMDMLANAASSPAQRALPAASSLAYVIYTSGSTGLPKGCCLTHANLSSYIQWANQYYFTGMQAKPSFGLYTSLSFDLTVTSIFCSLTSGGTLTVYPQMQDVAAILADSFAGANGINSIKLTPAHILLLKDAGIIAAAIDCAIVGGEEVTVEHVRILKQINPAMRVFNEYGPTEATVGCIVKELEAGQPVLIGKPISGAAIYLLDQQGQPCPVGVAGEICIAGAGLANGYLNKPELTAERFVANPFVPGERMYKTGDVGRWLANGELAFLGRRDEQVKIRGYRVEPAEVEAVLQACEGVSTAVVITINSNSGKELAAYVTAKDGIDTGELRATLAKSLPAYMVPAYIVQLEQLPFTINGKIDRKNLPHPAALGNISGTTYLAPRNETEEKLVAIWSEVLEIEAPRIGIHDNFFDLGGHSLKATRVASQVHKVFGINLNLNEIFTNPTIEAISNIIRADALVEQAKNIRSGNRNTIEV